MKTINIPLGFVVLFIMLLMIIFKVNDLSNNVSEMKSMYQTVMIVHDTVIIEKDTSTVNELIQKLDSIGK